MKVKDLIKELQKLDAEKTIGGWIDNDISFEEYELEIFKKEEIREKLKRFDYYV